MKIKIVVAVLLAAVASACSQLPFTSASAGNLKVERGISFEVITLAIEADGLLDELRYPNTEKYPNQSVLVVAFDNYVYLVPYVEKPDHFFLKTVIPSRKATRDYLLRRNSDEKT
jgi:hypothetical protein